MSGILIIDVICNVLLSCHKGIMFMIIENLMEGRLLRGCNKGIMFMIILSNVLVERIVIKELCL